ncbi:hypothetical protein J2848_005226 [Azospirillum lipoferum]|uniref:Uncharacterized protein n=1 Tax=Azospirillum lipoferum TaxID=193 RepID=A0A5A9GF12_AZOLI|nr:MULTISPECIES: hypothetical protein [Azospirillum]KAA0593128.1 hypothetical protein FZ942_24625 [Azospirillum lipoferum]MCP1613530.1 hypothetical protein [Azospirillum lipoferum]MDW5532299.1 hypothetical protein [Azospirillum sp. NL1]
MKAFAVAFLLWTVGTAQAAAPLDVYLAARDRHIAALNREAEAGDVDSVSRKEADARRELEGMLKAMVGPVTVRGFPADGRINLQTLLKELGFGMLDGIAYGEADNQRVVVATTEELLRSWLKEHRDWWPGLGRMPQDPRAAFGEEDFYTQAISTEASVARFASVPVKAPGAGFAVAMLAAARQDIGPGVPDRIVLSVLQGGRVFVAVEPVAAPIAPIPACDAVWKQHEEAARRAWKVFSASNQDEARRETLFKKATGLEAEGDRAYRRCFAQRSVTESTFQTVVRQAQALIDRLPLP